MITIWYVQHNNVILPQQHQHTLIMFAHILHICLKFCVLRGTWHVFV